MSLKQLMESAILLKLSLQKVTSPDRDLHFHSTINSKIKDQLQDLCLEAYSIAQKATLFRFQSWPFTSLEMCQDLEDKAADSLVDLIDFQLEKIDSILEKLKDPSLTKILSSTTTTPNHALSCSPLVAEISLKSRKFNFIHARNIPRPQDSFHDLSSIDNSRNSASLSLPKFTHPKPNCTCVPGSWSLKPGTHPYEEELQTLELPSWILEQSIQQPEHLFRPLEDTPLHVISDSEAFESLCQRISNENVIGVDVENHDYRSFQGFTCLLQISTRNEDFIIDTLACRPYMFKLNQIFSNPQILKVLHGAESDNLWLQRDFGIYLIGVFDTYFASKTLGLGSHSLAHLVQYYCGLQLNKAYQLADWRIRPLPEEMLAYARQDTHYLPYIWDRMRNEILAAGKGEISLLKQVFDRSKALCSRLYSLDPWGDHVWRSVASKYPKALDEKRMQVLKSLCDWRDSVARLEDESLHYVMPRAMLLRVVERLPERAEEILRCYNPCPPLVAQHVHDILMLIRNASAVIQGCEGEAVNAREKIHKEIAQKKQGEAKKDALIVPRNSVVVPIESGAAEGEFFFNERSEENDEKFGIIGQIVQQSRDSKKEQQKDNKKDQLKEEQNDNKQQSKRKDQYNDSKHQDKEGSNHTNSCIDASKEKTTIPQFLKFTKGGKEVDLTQQISKAKKRKISKKLQKSQKEKLESPNDNSVIVDLTAEYENSLDAAREKQSEMKDFDPNANASSTANKMIQGKNRTFDKRHKASQKSVTFALGN